jgi:hypothetical protein
MGIVQDRRAGVKGQGSPGRVSAGDWAAAAAAEQEARREEAGRRRWRTRRANGRDRPVIVPADKHPLAFRVPEDYDMDALPKRLRLPVSCFLDLVHRKQVNDQLNERGFVRLKAEYVRNVIGRRAWRELLPVLTGKTPGLPAVLETDGRYARGVARGYRLAAGCLRTKRLVCTDESFARKVRRVYAALAKQLPPEARWLQDKLPLLGIDLPKAARVIATMRPKKKKRKVRLTRAEHRQNMTELCRRIADKDPWLEVDDYGRVHTPVTNLPKALRGCLRVKGQKLVGLDLSNSQPLIAGLVAQRYYAGSKMSRHRLRRMKFGGKDPYWAVQRSLSAVRRPAAGVTGTWCHKSLQRKGVTKSLSQYTSTRAAPAAVAAAAHAIPAGPATHAVPTVPAALPGIPASPSCPAVLPDLDAYLAACQRGTFYRSLMTPSEKAQVAAEKAQGRRHFLGRLKVRVLAAFYSAIGRRRRFPNTTRKRLQAKYPSVARVLHELKEEDHRRAAWTMQAFESCIFVKRVCGRLRRRHPDIPVFTIHDSVLTTPEFVPTVEAVILDEFGKLGLRPSLKREDYA